MMDFSTEHLLMSLRNNIKTIMFNAGIICSCCIPFDVDEVTERMLHSVLNSIIYKQKKCRGIEYE